MSSKKSSLITRVEHLSFESMGVYMDVERHDGYVDISIDGPGNTKMAITLEDWKTIDKKIRELLSQP
jgi:hypothetical protein